MQLCRKGLSLEEVLLVATMEHAASCSDLPRMDELEVPLSGIQFFSWDH